MFNNTPKNVDTFAVNIIICKNAGVNAMESSSLLVRHIQLCYRHVRLAMADGN